MFGPLPHPFGQNLHRTCGGRRAGPGWCRARWGKQHRLWAVDAWRRRLASAARRLGST